MGSKGRVRMGRRKFAMLCLPIMYTSSEFLYDSCFFDLVFSVLLVNLQPFLQGLLIVCCYLHTSIYSHIQDCFLVTHVPNTLMFCFVLE